MDLFNLTRKKDVNAILENNKNSSLKRTMGAFDVTLMSIGATIGTGVMVLTGLVAATDAGPAVVLSFIFSAIACTLVALCYSEFASSIPSSGSAYSYIYVSLGEFIAHLVGWSLFIGYTVCAATVGSGWSAYFNGLLKNCGINLPHALINIPGQGGIINLPAIIVMLAITLLLTKGTSESKKVNNILVFIKLGIIALFVVVGVFFVKPSRWQPFMPFGVKGIFAGAASVFLAYTGFDAVSTSAEEVKNPQKNLPLGIIASMIGCTLIYIVVSLILTGLTNYTNLNVGDAMAYALSAVGQGWAASILSVGAVIGILAVIIAYLFGASRLLFSMSRDGLLPKGFSKLNKKTNVPVLSTWVVGCIGAVLAGVVNIKQLADLSNMIFLGSFSLVALSLIMFRKSYPDLKREFRVPLVPLLPLIAMAFCIFLMFSLSKITWLYFGAWVLLGAIVYMTYSHKHSLLQSKHSDSNSVSKTSA
ncbi:amino acid permease [Clostridium fermenticellae]|uniref:Amino acid permease n=1 Tax=Clostridium fermenticellae TaxID=2068654 RepID=A0A386H0D0_9CLOT|nr:amino acid permease [Clostridium fermenticellae]AYD39096.1 amino acid permease [Clostridium fermenticellae]